MENYDKYYSQFKNYLFSNIKILNILNSDNKEDYNNDWRNDIFYAISSDFINKWKSLINFDKICLKMNINKNNKIDDNRKDEIIKLIEAIPNLDKSFQDLKNEFSNEPIFNSIRKSTDLTFRSSQFDLISKNEWETFIEDNNFKDNGKVLIKKGNKKIMVKIDEKFYIIFYLKNINSNPNVNNIKEILPHELDKYLNELIIEIYNDNNNEIGQAKIEKFIDELIKENIYNWLEKINYNNEKREYIYEDINLIINEENRLKLSLNVSSIPKIDIEISTGKSVLKELDYINNIIIIKIKNSSYIIASMYSLSQIPEFSDYFYNENIQINHSSDLFYHFKKYIDTLWKKNEKEETFLPKDFILCLRNMDKNIFDFKQEKEPIIFINKLFEYLNEELNNKDINITNYLNNIAIKFNNIPDFCDYFKNKFMKNYNSIFSKVFYGIFQLKYSCQSCGESQDYKYFKYIDIDTIKYSNFEKEDLNNSLVYYYLDDLIEFSLNDKNSNSICKKCKKQNKLIERKIIRFPDTLIFNIKWEKFDNEKGFMSEENWLDSNKFIFEDYQIIDLSKYGFNNNNKNNNVKVKYKLISVINYGIINESNNYDKSWKKYITFSRHLINDKIYCYQPSGSVKEMHNFNRKKFVPSVLFYKKLKE